MSSTLPLSGKVALITGSSRGIGAAIAKRYASEGAHVIINYVSSSSAASAVVDAINEEGKGKAAAVQADLSSVAEAKKLLNKTIEVFGKLDILVLNAALMHMGKLDDLDESTFDEHFSVNVKVPLFLTQAASPYLSPGSRVIFLSTGLTKNSSPPPIMLLYTSTKGAINQFVRVLSKDLGTRGITVNAIAPGPVDTDMLHTGRSEEEIKFHMNLHPEKRVGKVEEVAAVAAFLAKEESQWVNGEILFVNGAHST